MHHLPPLDILTGGTKERRHLLHRLFEESPDALLLFAGVARMMTEPLKAFGMELLIRRFARDGHCPSDRAQEAPLGTPPMISNPGWNMASNLVPFGPTVGATPDDLTLATQEDILAGIL